MNLFLFIWRWLNKAHCVCGSDSPEICHAHEPRRLAADPLDTGECCMCHHAQLCHQLSGKHKPA